MDELKEVPKPTLTIKDVIVPTERKLTKRGDIPFDGTKGQMLLSPGASDLLYNIGVVPDDRVYELPPDPRAGEEPERVSAIDLTVVAGAVADDPDKRQLFLQQIHSDLHQADIIGYVHDMAKMTRDKDDAGRAAARERLDTRYREMYEIRVKNATGVQKLLTSEYGPKLQHTAEGGKFYAAIASKTDEVLGKNPDGSYSTRSFTEVLDEAFTLDE